MVQSPRLSCSHLLVLLLLLGNGVLLHCGGEPEASWVLGGEGRARGSRQQPQTELRKIEKKKRVVWREDVRAGPPISRSRSAAAAVPTTPPPAPDWQSGAGFRGLSASLAPFLSSSADSTSSSSTCYTLHMMDEYGDGWQGYTLTFSDLYSPSTTYHSGSTVTSREGDQAYDTVCLPSCSCALATSPTDSYPSEVSWSLSVGGVAGTTALSVTNGTETTIFCQPAGCKPPAADACPAGQGLLPPNYSSCSSCPVGTYRSASSSSPFFCTPCPSGTSAADDDPGHSSLETACRPCPPGSSSPFLSPSCTLCPPGTFQPSSGQSFCAACPWDTHADPTATDGGAGKSAQAEACLPCPEGTHTPHAASTSGEDCRVDGEAREVLRRFRAGLLGGGGGEWRDWPVDDEEIGVCRWPGVECNDEGEVSAIELYENGLYGTLEGAGGEGVSLGALTELEYLDLGGNSIFGPLPEWLKLNTKIQSLYLNANIFTGSIDVLLGLTSLTQLWLFDNFLVGGIPPQIGALTNLIELNLRNNSLGGPIPPEIGDLTNLQVLELSQCRLVGTLPPTLGRLTRLVSLAMYINFLEGPLDEEIFRSPALQELYLYKNRLNQTIPNAMWRHEQLKYVSLFENEFSGQLPSDISSAKKLSLLYLNSNLLTGRVPESLGSMDWLLTLDLGNNLFVGDLPSSVVELCYSHPFDAFGRPRACSFMPSPYMCDARERLLGFECAPCSNCAPKAQCYNDFDNDSYLCDQCLPGYAVVGDACISCDGPGSAGSLIFWGIFFAAGTCIALLFYAAKRSGRFKFSLSFADHIRLKQVGCVLQLWTLVPKFASCPPWFEAIVRFFGNFSLPLPATSCVTASIHMSRWSAGLITSILYFAVIAILVNSRYLLSCFGRRRVPFGLDHHFFYKVQLLCSFLLSQAVVVLVPSSFNPTQLIAEEVGKYTRVVVFVINSKGEEDKYNGANAYDAYNRSFSPVMRLLVGEVSVTVLIVTSIFYLYQYGSKKYEAQKLRYSVKFKSERSSEPEQTEPLLNDEIIDELVPFWASFNLMYTPQCRNFESVVHFRKVALTLLPGLMLLANHLVIYVSLKERANVFSSGIPPIDIARAPLASSAIITFFALVVHYTYLVVVLRRPYISNVYSLRFGDPTNDADLVSTRAMVWASTVLLIGQALAAGGLTMAAQITTNAISIFVLVGILWFHRILFSSALAPSSTPTAQTQEDTTMQPRPTAAESLAAHNEQAIEKMQDCTSVIKMFHLFADLNVDSMIKSERVRWQRKPEGDINTPGDNGSFARSFRSVLKAPRRVGRTIFRTLRPFLFTIAVLVLFFSMVGLLWATCTVKSLTNFWVGATVLLLFYMEWTIHTDHVALGRNTEAAISSLKNSKFVLRALSSFDQSKLFTSRLTREISRTGSGVLQDGLELTNRQKTRADGNDGDFFEAENPMTYKEEENRSSW